MSLHPPTSLLCRIIGHKWRYVPAVIMGCYGSHSHDFYECDRCGKNKR